MSMQCVGSAFNSNKQNTCKLTKMALLNLENKTSYEWPHDKFENRLFMIKEIIEDYHDTGILPKLTNEQDPFWDPEDINLTKANKQKLENDDDDEMLIVGKNNMQ